MPPNQPTGTIEIATVDPVIGGEVTFTVTTVGLKGNQYPLVLLQCRVGETVVYGQLAAPDEVFILGGGSSPWITPSDPNYLAPAVCTPTLWSYGGPQGEVQLAAAPSFEVPA